MTRLRTQIPGVSKLTDFEIEYIPEDEDNKSYVNQMEYISAIINKIKSGDDADIENCGLRPIRELLQNADDAGATQLVFRFDKDRLWVQNNGLTMEDRYLSALSSLGKEDKKEDAGTSGTFGTGFRSTHMFTDTPEIEWVEFHPGVEKYRVIAKKMTLSLEEWKDIPERKNLASSQFMQSEGVRDPKKLGVFFSFPWRVTNETNREEFDEYLWDVPESESLLSILRNVSGRCCLGAVRFQE